jgi:lysozyme
MVVVESTSPPGKFRLRARRPEEAGGTRSRRRLTVIASVLAVTAIVAAIGWIEVIPQYRPQLRAGESYGIDVSNHQGKIDWKDVASDEISFAYMKATEGDDFVDKQFTANWSGAAEAGIARGAYHFFTLCSSGAAQAANFLRVLPTDPQALAPAIDLEYSGCTKRPDNATFQRELRTFIETVEGEVGRQIVVYAMPSFTKAYPLESWTRDRWVRRLFRRPADDTWAVWQVSDRGRVKGIDAPVDIDVWRPIAGR